MIVHRIEYVGLKKFLAQLKKLGEERKGAEKELTARIRVEEGRRGP